MTYHRRVWRLATIVILLAGCRQILGIGDPRLTGGDAPGEPPSSDGTTDAPRTIDAPHAPRDAAVDAARPSGLVAEWRFDDGTGATADDDAPIDPANPSTLAAEANAEYTWTPGALDVSAGRFASVSTAVANAIHTSGALSIELWLTSGAAVANANVFGVFDDLGLAAGVTLNGGKLTGDIGGTAVAVSPPTGLTQVVLTYDGTNLAISVDGAASTASGSLQEFGLDANATVELGGNGAVDEAFSRARIFDRALTVAEIRASYLAGDGDP